MQKPQSAIVSKQSKLAKFLLPPRKNPRISRTVWEQLFHPPGWTLSLSCDAKMTGCERNLALIRGGNAYSMAKDDPRAGVNPAYNLPARCEPEGKKRWYASRGISSIGEIWSRRRAFFCGHTLCAPETAKIPPFLHMGKHRIERRNEPYHAWRGKKIMNDSFEPFSFQTFFQKSLKSSSCLRISADNLHFRYMIRVPFIASLKSFFVFISSFLLSGGQKTFRINLFNIMIRYNLISKIHNFNNRGESGNRIEGGFVSWRKVNLEIRGIYDLLKVQWFLSSSIPRF